MKTKIAVAIILILCWKWSLCQQVTIEEAIAVAKTELLYTKGFDVNVIDVHQFDSNGHTLLYENVSDNFSPEKNQGFSSTRYYKNNHSCFWAKTLAVISGVSFVTGTCFIAWARGYDYNKNHYRTDGEGPVDLTVPFNTAIGLLFYTVSVGTAIPAIVLFKKTGKNTESAVQLSQNGGHLFANGYECKLGVYPGGLGINFEF
ncbi:MAG: hypothetical protein IKJ81_07180 [Bacteroidales bacterium]|nr:hypothetical protein [Bacteroidales bacterium]